MYFHAATKMSMLTQDNKETMFFKKILNLSLESFAFKCGSPQFLV